MSASSYVTAATVHRLRLGLTAREADIIRTLTRVRVATALQLEALHFADVTTRRARAALAAMTQRRILARLPRVVGGARAGSAGYVYGLDAAGARLAALIHPGTPERLVRPWGMGRTFLAHALAVTEVYVGLTQATRRGELRLVSFSGEPHCWRSFTGQGGRSVLKPDAHVVIETGGYEDHWFVEVDLATEAAAVVGRKCQVYRRYWQTGIEQDRTDLFPRVLWLVPDEQRAERLEDVISRLPTEARDLFVVALQVDAVTRLRLGAA